MERDSLFGFERVTAVAKSSRVKEVFDSVADRYDLMNDLMSFGMHRLWKRFAVEILDSKPGEIVLDLAAGTADLARLIDKRASGLVHIMVCDINASMLEIGRDRSIDKAVTSNIDYLQGSAEAIPLKPNSVDRVIIGFGLRNVTRRTTALEEMYRILRPGGRLVVLEFSSVKAPFLASLYEIYSFRALPLLGGAVTGHAESYRYLAESIRVHPDQEALKYMMRGVGFEGVRYNNVMAGVVAIHIGHKY